MWPRIIAGVELAGLICLVVEIRGDSAQSATIKIERQNNEAASRALSKLWEMPIAVGMAFIGEGLATWLALGQPMATGMIAALAYLGPRGSEVLFMRWFGAKALNEK